MFRDQTILYLKSFKGGVAFCDSLSYWLREENTVFTVQVEAA